MSFFRGSLAFVRFQVSGKSPGEFAEKQLEQLAAHAIGTQKVSTSDGVEVGWTAGDHILDTRFERIKNIVSETLQFALRIDQHRIPSDLLRAYTAVELHGLAASNPSGIPSQRQRREARANAMERLEKEARDGRFLRRKAYPMLWDGPARELLVGTTSVTVLDRLHTLFKETFDSRFEPMGAGPRAFALAEVRQQTRNVEDAQPSSFVGGPAPRAFAWVPDEASRDFLGNEFLLWLWFHTEVEGETIKLGDDTELTLMFARTLSLECPRGLTGKESIQSDIPTRLPEARRAIQAGKLPRKAGLTIVRQDEQYELTLHAESLGVTGVKLPTPDAVEESARLDERVGQLRHLIETIDLLYDGFCQIRCGADWPKHLLRIQKWLEKDERVSKTPVLVGAENGAE